MSEYGDITWIPAPPDLGDIYRAIKRIEEKLDVEARARRMTSDRLKEVEAERVKFLGLLYRVEAALDGDADLEKLRVDIGEAILGAVKR